MAVTDAHGTTTAPDPEWPGRSAGLSERESEVLALLAQGLTNREIAEVVFLSPETIKSYVAQIYSKLDVRNRVEASRFAHRSGEFEE
jgi:DNA-binding NarL/FixJ family response regulator